MTYRTIYLDRFRRRKTHELLWAAYLQDESGTHTIAWNADRDECRADARDYVEHVLEERVNAIVVVG